MSVFIYYFLYKGYFIYGSKYGAKSYYNTISLKQIMLKNTQYQNFFSFEPHICYLSELITSFIHTILL